MTYSFNRYKLTNRKKIAKYAEDGNLLLLKNNRIPDNRNPNKEKYKSIGF